MPTTRRQSQGPAASGPSTPLASVSASASASGTSTPTPAGLLSPLRRSTRSVSRTPSAIPGREAEHPAHLSAADELALAEAAKILHTPTRVLRSQSAAPASYTRSHSKPPSTSSNVSSASASASTPYAHGHRAGGSGRMGSPRVEILVPSPRKAGGTRGKRGGAKPSALVMTTGTGTGEADDDEQENEEEEVEEEQDAQSQASAATDASSVALTTGTSAAFVDGLIGSAVHSDLDDIEEAGSAGQAQDGSLAGGDDEEDDASTAKAESPRQAASAVSDEEEEEEEEQRKGQQAVGDATSSDSLDSGSDSDDSTATEDDSESDPDDEDESDEEDLDRLLAAAKLSAQKAQNATAGLPSSAVATGADDVFGLGDESVLQLDKDDEVKDAPIPRMSIPAVSNPSLTFGRPAQAGPSHPMLNGNNSDSRKKDKGKGKANGHVTHGALPAVPEGVEMDTRPYERTMSKREKAAQPKKATTSELWSTIPSTRADLLPQMKRDYQALALANSLDPKRFMKGGGKSTKVPENFAIGTVIEQSRKLQSTTLQNEKKYRPGQLVQGIAQDEGVGAYAKRKFGDLQWGRMENGKGKGWKKRSKW